MHLKYCRFIFISCYLYSFSTYKRLEITFTRKLSKIDFSRKNNLIYALCKNKSVVMYKNVREILTFPDRSIPNNSQYRTHSMLKIRI